MSGGAVVALWIGALILVLMGSGDLGELMTGAVHDTGYTWPLGLLWFLLGSASVVAGFLLLSRDHLGPAVACALGWVVLDVLAWVEIGEPFALGPVVLSVPFIAWGAWARLRSEAAPG